ncbi:MAG TPA: hypothetical protein VGM93_08560, partial [Acidimicrobiales bacterium]
MAPGAGPFVLGVDLDGVCADYSTALRELLAADRGIPPADLGPQLSWDFREWGLDRQAFDDIHRRAVLDHHIFREMPAIAGCAEALWRLSDA